MLEVWPSHGQDRGRLRPTLKKMPALWRQSRIGHHCPCDSIQGRGLVRDGLRRKEIRRRRRRQSGQACFGIKRSCQQREGPRGERNDNEGNVFQRIERQEACKEEVSPARSRWL